MSEDDLTSFCVHEYPRLVGALSLYTGDANVAEEIAQETVVRIVERWSTVRTLDAPGAWAHRVAINLANSAFRRRQASRRAQARLAARPTTGAYEPDTAEALAVRAAVARLPARERAVLVLRFFSDLPVGEVADLLRMPEGTVKTTTARALARLRDADFDLSEVRDDT